MYTLIRTRSRTITAAFILAVALLLSDPSAFLPRSWQGNALLRILSVGRADAAISYVQNLGTYASTSSSSSTTVSIGSSVTAGNSIIVTIAIDYDNSGSVSCSDSRGNSYTVDVDQIYSSYVRTIVCSAHNVTALSSGDTITVSHPSAAPRAVSVHEFSGLAPTGTLDRTASATGSSSSFSSGSTSTTTQADELLIGAIGTDGRITDTFTPGSGYTALTRAGTNSTGMWATNNTINPEYRIVSSTGSYVADGTNSTSRRWAATIATYKAEIISGTVYTDEGTTNIGSGKTIRLVVNGSDMGTATTDSSGSYTFTATTSPGDAVLV